MSQLIIFDWDGTLAVPQSGETFRKSGERYKWIEDDGMHSNRKELLEWLSSENYLAIATNQGGISFGIIGWQETERAIWALLKELDAPIPLLICPYHERYPERYPDYRAWRKPLPGMLLALHRLFPAIPPENVVVVGDREEDMHAAHNAGFEYEEADAFFARIQGDLEDFISQEQNAGEVFDDAIRTLNLDEPPF